MGRGGYLTGNLRFSPNSKSILNRLKKLFIKDEICDHDEWIDISEPIEKGEILLRSRLLIV